MGSGPRIAVVDYGIGNLRSAHKALVHVGANALLTADPEQIAAAAAVVLPGVGAFGACMAALRGSGLEEVVVDSARSSRPFLGICVGMQMLFDGSDEDPDAHGLGIIGGRVEWLPDGVVRPQMQWNRLRLTAPDVLWAGLGDAPWMYFVHSLRCVPTDPSTVVATCEYGGTVNVACRQGNLVATQFHPEKSGHAGLALLANFVRSVTGS